MKRLLVIALSTAVLASCGGDTKTSKNAEELAKLKKERATLDEKIKKMEGAMPADTSRKATAVTTMPATFTAFNGWIDVQSSIESDEDIVALPQAPGTVTAVNVVVGQRVNKGQILAVIDAATVDQQIKAQEAQLAFAKTVYEKQQRLWAQNIGSEIQLLQAKSNYEAMQKQREANVAQRNMYRIVAPISGIVDAVDARVGSTSGGLAGGGIHIVNNNKLKAEANLGESYLGKVKAGDDVTLIFGGDSIKTKLSYVAQAVDPVSRAFMVQVRLGSSAKLHPNMSAKMRINNYTNNSVIIIPVTSIQVINDVSTVYVAEGNKAKKVTVEQGRNSNGMVEILSGLKAGDKVITEGLEDLDDGEEIQVK